VINKEISIILPIYNEKESLPIMVRLLESSIKFKKEIIIVHDTENDTALEIANELVNEFDDVHIVQNKISKGVKYAIETGVSKAKYDTFIILAVDEIFPIIAIDKMLDLMINKNLDFISGTRYAKGGIRLGGSLIGSIFSTIANKVFQFLTKIPISDCTTGIKMMKKNVWKSVRLESKPIGWAFSFELSIKVYLQEFKIDEYPLKSVDRLFGGSSTFKFGPWLKEYFKWFIWGIKKIKYEK